MNTYQIVFLAFIYMLLIAVLLGDCFDTLGFLKICCEAIVFTTAICLIAASIIFGFIKLGNL